jgi:hypothetical protein
MSIFCGQAQVVFVHTQGILMPVENVNIFLLVFIRDLQLASFLNMLSGKPLPLHFWKAVVHVLTYYKLLLDLLFLCIFYLPVW